MKSKKEIPAICEAVFGRLPERAQWAWSAIADLERVHKASSVVLDFRDWASENAGDDFPKGILTAYLAVASDRLGRSGSTTALQAHRNPEVLSLTRELTYLSGGSASFLDKHRARLAEVLAEYSKEEVIDVWKTWIGEQIGDDPKFWAGKFVQSVDDLCYTARRKKQEAEETKALRDQTAARLQEQAEQERLAKARQEKLVEDFDPLAD